jgi:hypothetical protein
VKSLDGRGNMPDDVLRETIFGKRLQVSPV